MKSRSGKNYTEEEPCSDGESVLGLPEDVKAIRAEISRFLNSRDAQGEKIGNHTNGVYTFYDYDKEPIYVGQTHEKLRTRIRRHLTNQRTDAVAMNVLDPFEVAEVEVWPLDREVSSMDRDEKREFLDKAEFTVFQKVLRESALGAVLNEKPITPRGEIVLPQSYRQRIIPDTIFRQRIHPDIRIARRASTIANLARVISERDVSPGLRQTLLTQAMRLETLARRRLEELGISERNER